MSLDSENEWKFQTSRRGLLKFLSGATLVGGTAVAARAVPDPAEGMVKLATPEDVPPVPAWDERNSIRHSRDGHMDVVPWRLYDSNQFVGYVGGKLHFFAHTYHQNYSLAETNMQMGNSLPAPQSFQIRRMWLLLLGDRDSAELFASKSSLELVIGQKIYSQVSALDVSRYGLEEIGLKPASAQDEPGPRCMDFTALPLTIEVQQFFSVRLYCDCTVPSKLMARCVLDGLMARGIQ
jgi:hypothetical protein